MAQVLAGGRGSLSEGLGAPAACSSCSLGAPAAGRFVTFLERHILGCDPARPSSRGVSTQGVRGSGKRHGRRARLYDEESIVQWSPCGGKRHGPGRASQGHASARGRTAPLSMRARACVSTADHRATSLSESSLQSDQGSDSARQAAPVQRCTGHPSESGLRQLHCRSSPTGSGRGCPPCPSRRLRSAAGAAAPPALILHQCRRCV